MQLEVSWAQLKLFLDSKSIKCQFIEFDNMYIVVGIDGTFALSAKILKVTPASADQTVFETNYKAAGNIPLQDTDTEGRQISRNAYGKKGWSYVAHPVEFTTSKLNECFSQDWQGNDRTDFTFKFYNSSGVELVAGTQVELDTDCVETRITIAPDYDYEVISGKIEQHASPSVDIRMWVVGGVINTTTNYPWEYPVDSGIFYVKEFASGINLKFMGADQEIETDGRASKFMCKNKGLAYNANQMQIIIKHPAGHKHDLMVILEYFRA